MHARGEKDLRLVCREFHTRGEELWKERSENFSLLVRGGSKRYRYSEDERGLQVV